MNIDDCMSDDVHTSGGGEFPPCTGFVADALPDVQGSATAENLRTGVSTNNARPHTVVKHRRSETTPHWYALRCTYGREKLAYDYLVANGVTAFYPTTNVVKFVNGKRKVITESRLPNIFFAYATEQQLKTFVYDNVNLSFLRFYYRHVHVGNQIEKTPLIVPDKQMESFRIICDAALTDSIISLGVVPKFEKGQSVRITAGPFKGVVGIVARWQGQQRVGVVVDGLLTVTTAYVPSGFLENVE